MKNARFLLLFSTVLLTACGSPKNGGVSLQENLQNPLFAQRYYEDMAGQMVTFVLNKDSILKDDAKKAAVDAARSDATKRAGDALNIKQQGRTAFLISEQGLSEGNVLILKDTLYLGPDFLVSPSPSMHLYLSDITDPRLASFPDTTAVDLGLVQNPYGAQSVELPKNDVSYRTVVLWDTKLKMVYGFAQFSGQ